jgi:DNA-binding GntR family transcriptional regulator
MTPDAHMSRSQGNVQSRSDGAQGSRVDRVQGAIRDKILAGFYPPGSRLILSRLAAEHGVSFIPIREALQRLEAERLVKNEQNRGARVAEISIADMRDIYETRVVLEQHAVRWRRIGPDGGEVRGRPPG